MHGLLFPKLTLYSDKPGPLSSKNSGLNSSTAGFMTRLTPGREAYQSNVLMPADIQTRARSLFFKSLLKKTLRPLNQRSPVAEKRDTSVERLTTHRARRTDLTAVTFTNSSQRRVKGLVCKSLNDGSAPKQSPKGSTTIGSFKLSSQEPALLSKPQQLIYKPTLTLSTFRRKPPPLAMLPMLDESTEMTSYLQDSAAASELVQTYDSGVRRPKITLGQKVSLYIDSPDIIEERLTARYV
jgi:hypothetical protein